MRFAMTRREKNEKKVHRRFTERKKKRTQNDDVIRENSEDGDWFSVMRE